MILCILASESEFKKLNMKKRKMRKYIDYGMFFYFFFKFEVMYINAR